MSIVPILLAAALLVLAVAFGLHCLVLHCDEDKKAKWARDHESK